MKIKLWHLIFGGFILFSFTDLITTFLATSKHGLKYEANIIYTITGSFIFFIIFKIAFSGLYGWLLYKGYNKLEYPVVRYLFIYTACIFVFLLGYVSINNYDIYNIEESEIGRALTRQEKIDYYQEQMTEGSTYDPAIVKNNSSSKDGNYTFLFNIFQFLCWRSFEKRREVNEQNTTNK